MRRIVILIGLGVFVFLGCTPTIKKKSPLSVASGTLERITDFDSKHIEARNIDIWLPSGYQSNSTYSVLYMHDGQMLYDANNTWNNQEWGVDEVMTNLLNERKIDSTIVVGIWNNSKNRHADYFPEKPFLSLPKSYRDTLYNLKRDDTNLLFSTPVQSDAYLKFIVSELKPYIDREYATKKRKENTYIAGSSMGGLISMYAICEYPSIFGGAACLSTHWPGIFETKNNPIPEAFMHYMEENMPNPKTHKFYFDFGTETLDALYEPYQKQIDSILVHKGYNKENWTTRKFEGENHSENAWRKRLHIPITFLLQE